MRGVLCCGNVSADIQVRPVEQLGWGQTTWVERIELTLGGNGGSTSYTLAKLGCPVRLVTAVGRDDFGDDVLERLRAVGVDLSRVERVDNAATPASIGVVHPTGMRALLHHPGASRVAFPHGIPLTDDLAGDSGTLHIANIFSLECFQRHAAPMLREARGRRMRTSVDTGWDARGLWMERLGDCLAYTDLLLANEEEAKRLSRESHVEQAAEALRSLGAGSVVVKLGGEGCWVSTDDERFHSPGFRVEAVDTTGAGDCFAGGYLAALERGFSHQESARFANAVGALSVSCLGPVTGIRTFGETQEWMQSLE